MMRWSPKIEADADGTPHLTPTLSAPEGGEGATGARFSSLSALQGGEGGAQRNALGG
jgi:hypothetical protein